MDVSDSERTAAERGREVFSQRVDDMLDEFPPEAARCGVADVGVQLSEGVLPPPVDSGGRPAELEGNR